MVRLLLNRWRGQFESPSVIRTIRRKIGGGIIADKTVLADFENSDVTAQQVIDIMAGWDASRVKGCGCVHSLPYPLPPDVPGSNPSQDNAI